MQRFNIDKEELVEIIATTVEATIKSLEQRNALNLGNAPFNVGTTGNVGNVGTANANSKTAYQKVEQLLYNYKNFKKVVAERNKEIEELRANGIPQRSCSIVEYSSGGGSVQKGIVLEDEAVEVAVQNILASVQGTVQVIDMIDKALAALKYDPYYEILEMRYFQGCTQEEIAFKFKCDQSNISRNKARLVREMALRIFPNDTIKEYMV